MLFVMHAHALTSAHRVGGCLMRSAKTIHASTYSSSVRVGSLSRRRCSSAASMTGGSLGALREKVFCLWGQQRNHLSHNFVGVQGALGGQGHVGEAAVRGNGPGGAHSLAKEKVDTLCLCIFGAHVELVDSSKKSHFRSLHMCIC